MGMIWKVLPDETFLTDSLRIAETLAQLPPIGLALTKQALQASWSHTLNEQLDLERDLQRELGRSHDYAEGVSAFLQKRKPQFTGR